MGSSSNSRSGALNKQPAQRHAAALAAGERAHVRVGRRQAQRVHRVLQLRVEVPSVGGFDLGLDLAELLGGLIGVVGGQLVEAVEQRPGGSDRLFDVALDVLGLVQVGLLLEHPHARPRSEHRIAAVVLVDAGHDPQQRGLARAVVAEHADLRAGIEGKRDVVEHRLVGRMQLGQAVHREDVLRGHAGAGYEVGALGTGR